MPTFRVDVSLWLDAKDAAEAFDLADRELARHLWNWRGVIRVVAPQESSAPVDAPAYTGEAPGALVTCRYKGHMHSHCDCPWWRRWWYRSKPIRGPVSGTMRMPEVKLPPGYRPPSAAVSNRCPWCHCLGYHSEVCEGFEVNDPARKLERFGKETPVGWTDGLHGRPAAQSDGADNGS